jgi:pteridine reductase
MAEPCSEAAPVALVTGAAHRLGRALALGLAKRGFRIALHYHSSKSAAAECLEALSCHSEGHASFKADLSSVAACKNLVADVSRHFQRLDALVHGASPWIEGPFDSVKPEDWDAVFLTGPKAGFFLAQAAAPSLRAREGSILLISDVAATKAWPHHIPHACAKAAINALVLNLSVAMAPLVRVNGLAPGIVLPPQDLDTLSLGRLVNRTPLQRLVAVEDLVEMAIALLLNRSVTGQVLAVDAGRSAV